MVSWSANNLPLSGANAVPLGSRTRRTPLSAISSSLGKPPLFEANAIPLGARRTSVFRQIEFPEQSAAKHLGPSLRPPLRRGGAAIVSPCSRCLAPDHGRRACCWPIRCHACDTSGHVSASCPVKVIKPRQAAGKMKELTTLINSLSWFKFVIRSGPSAPPIFNSFGDMVAAFRLLGPNQNFVPEFIVPWHLRPSPPQMGCEWPDLNLPANLDPSARSLAAPSPSPATSLSTEKTPTLSYSTCLRSSPVSLR